MFQILDKVEVLSRLKIYLEINIFLLKMHKLLSFLTCDSKTHSSLNSGPKMGIGVSLKLHKPNKGT